jgi:KDO2-lipid IV(A) lauroyltransferase
MHQATLFKILSKLPLNVLYLSAGIGYLVYYYIFRYRRELVFNNLQASFPEKTNHEINQLSKIFYKNISQVAVESIKTISITEDDLIKRVRIVNADILTDYIARKQPVVFLASHQCNWEWLLMAICLKLPMPITAAYKPLPSNPLDELMLEARSRFRGRLIPVKSFIMEVARTKGTWQGFTMVADQTPRRREEKYWTTFLNQDTAFFVGPQKIARLTDAPVVFMGMKRVRRGHYEVTLKVLTQPPYVKSGFELMNRYIKEVENQIRQYPADWFWLYRKWPYKKPLYAD